MQIYKYIKSVEICCITTKQSQIIYSYARGASAQSPIFLIPKLRDFVSCDFEFL